MARFGKADAMRSFRIWLNVTKRREAKAYNDVGGYLLDYSPIYGGVLISRVIDEKGSIKLVGQRMTAREFDRAVYFLQSDQWDKEFK